MVNNIKLFIMIVIATFISHALYYYVANILWMMANPDTCAH